MASRKSTVDFILDQLQEAGPASARPMFGEYGLYLADRMFALVCDDSLFIKRTPEGEALYPSAPLALPYPGAKPCLLVPPERWDEAEWLCLLAKVTAGALPAPRKKPRRD
nr:TfoX/Sxy family protein [uncultured Holophaga sp.]